jgi:hypothetical protein
LKEKEKVMLYTFVKGANIPASVQIGDSHTWMQMRPQTGSYANPIPGGAPKEITGVVVAIDEDLWVRVEAEHVPTEGGRS